MLVALQLVGVAVVPLNFTVLVPCVAPKFAPAIVTGLFYALLAVIVGSAVVALGGGGIPVARRYLDRASTKLEEKGPEMRQASQGADERIQERAQSMRDQLSAS